MNSTLTDIIEKITSYDIRVVSFDIFDTLLLRPVLSPTDVFRIVGKRYGFTDHQFVTMRTVAEQEARNNRPFGKDDITLDDIYMQMEKLFQLKSVDQKIYLMKKEI